MFDSLSVLRPQIIRIGNRRYRKNPVKYCDVDDAPIPTIEDDDDESTLTCEAPRHKGFALEDESDRNFSHFDKETNQKFDEEIDQKFVVTEDGGGKGRYKASIAIPNAYLGQEKVLFYSGTFVINLFSDI